MVVLTDTPATARAAAEAAAKAAAAAAEAAAAAAADTASDSSGHSSGGSPLASMLRGRKRKSKRLQLERHYPNNRRASQLKQKLLSHEFSLQTILSTDESINTCLYKR